MVAWKAAVVCGTPPELLKYGGEEMVRELTTLFNLIVEEKIVPEEWKRAIIVPIFKNKGSKLDCGNYRSISLISVVFLSVVCCLLSVVWYLFSIVCFMLFYYFFYLPGL